MLVRMTDHSAALEASLALYAETAGDPVAPVYARLFAQEPAMAAEFWRDSSGAIRGEMLTRTLEVAVDLAGPRSWAPAFLATEIVTHENYGIPRGVFVQFLPLVAAEIAAGCGAGFTPAMADAWSGVLAEAETHLSQQ
jgi:hypothetical protein